VTVRPHLVPVISASVLSAITRKAGARNVPAEAILLWPSDQHSHRLDLTLTAGADYNRAGYSHLVATKLGE